MRLVGHCKHLTPEYKKLGAAVLADASLSNVVVAKVNADTHRSLGERFGVRGFPTLKWIPMSGGDPEDYKSQRSSEAMLAFIKEKAAADGAFGRIASLDAIAAKMHGKADAATLATVAKEMEAAVAAMSDEVEKESGAVYAKMASKIEAKGEAFITKEIDRLARILGSGNVESSKAVLMMKKKNILSAFLAPAAGEPEEEEGADTHSEL